MSVLVRAAYIDNKAANQAEKDMNKQLDRKEKDLDTQKAYNRVLDKLEDARSDNNFTAQEKQAIVLYAQEAGITLDAKKDFAAFEEVHGSPKFGGNAWIDEKSVGAEGSLQRNSALDNVRKKIERHQKAADDASKGGDLKRNIAMNEYVQANKDSNATINRIKDLRASLAPSQA